MITRGGDATVAGVADPRRRQEVERVVVQLTRLGLQLSDAAADAIGDREVASTLHTSLLFALDVDGALRPTAIQELTGLSSGGVTKLIERLEERGMVVRRTGAIEGDRRGVSVEITRKGRHTVRSMADAMAARMADVAPLAKELDDIVGS